MSDHRLDNQRKHKDTDTHSRSTSPVGAWQPIAEQIASDLFVNGAGQRARRLVLEGEAPVYINLGGWGEKPMADRIAKLLHQLLPAPPLAEAQSADAARTVLPSNDKEIQEAESRGAERGRREALEAAANDVTVVDIGKVPIPEEWRDAYDNAMHVYDEEASTRIEVAAWLRTRATQEGQQMADEHSSPSVSSARSAAELITRLREAAHRESMPDDVLPEEADVVLGDCPEVTWEDLHEMAGLMNEAADGLATAEREATDLRAQIERHRSMFWPNDNDHDAHLYEIRNGLDEDYVRAHAAELIRESKQAHQPLRALIAKWRGADADDAVSRGYVETGNTFQVCANELEAALQDSGGTR